ncbi:DnaA/Hda family protein [Desulfovibrio aminophilus]|nr:DnaA/Hda family protein [Desulfovibrio aminophilus]MCM0753673.1 DnaA/Hda family protein [Desulfovibrio aminophilus]
MVADAWNHIYAALEKNLSSRMFTVWIKPLDGEVSDGVLRLLAPNDFVAAWVRDRLLDAVSDCAAQILGSRPEIRVEVRRAPAQPAAKPEAELPAPAPSQLGLPIVHTPRPLPQHKWRFTLDDFVVGPSNELAWAAASSLCRGTLTSDNLFLGAGPGLGKTHLLHGIGQALSAQSNRRAPHIACLTAEEFATRLVLAIKAREVTRFKAEFREAADVLLLEDVHFFQGKEKMQDELLCTLKALQARGCKVVCTSSFLPLELAGLDSSLVSQFCSGFLANIEKPDFETRRRIVERKAKTLQIAVPESVSELLAERVTSDIRQLESCLRNLVLKARLLNQAVTLDLAWDVLRNYAVADARPDFERILEFICARFALTPEQLASRSRKQAVVAARNAAFYLARKHTSLSLSAIGERLGRKHSTVLKGITNLEREISLQTPMGRQMAATLDRITA